MNVKINTEKMKTELKSKIINKSLISIIIISMLTMSGIAVASARSPGPTPTPTSTAEAVQDQRLTNLETNDTNQSVNNTEQQSLINTLSSNIKEFTDQINQLINRVTNLENDPYPKVYSADFNFGEPAVFIYPPNLANGIKTLNISLPRDSIVHIEGTGFIAGWKNYSNVQLSINDTNIYPTLAYTITKDYSNNTMTSGFSVSRTIFLPAGNHTIYLVAALGGYGQHEDYAYATAQSELTATAYDTNKGEIQSSQ